MSVPNSASISSFEQKGKSKRTSGIMEEQQQHQLHRMSSRDTLSGNDEEDHTHRRSYEEQHGEAVKAASSLEENEFTVHEHHFRKDTNSSSSFSTTSAPVAFIKQHQIQDTATTVDIDVDSLMETKESVQLELERTQRELVRTTSLLAESQAETMRARDDSKMLDEQLKITKKDARRMENRLRDIEERSMVLEEQLKQAGNLTDVGKDRRGQEDKEQDNEKTKALIEEIEMLREQVATLEEELKQPLVLVKENPPLLRTLSSSSVSDEFNELRRDFNEKLRLLENEYNTNVADKDKQLEDAGLQLETIKADYLSTRALALELQEREQFYISESKIQNSTLDQSVAERNEIWDLMQIERKKFQRQESEFKLFAAKIKSQSDANM